MKYVALLRGINVGGKNIIKMADLKEVVGKCGFTNVSTYIQSGNVIFESEAVDIDDITNKLRDSLLKHFDYNSNMVVKSSNQLRQIVSEVPADWKKRSDLRCYIAFICKPVSMDDVLSEVELKEGIDFIKPGEGVLYMSTLSSGLTKSRFTRLITKDVYKWITMRNYNTAQKVAALMD